MTETPAPSRAGLTARSKLERLPPPSLGDKLRRGLWRAAWTLLCRFSPTPLHGWRRLILRMAGARIGPRVAIYPSVDIWAPWRLSIADGATVGGGATLYNVARISIGKRAIVSQGAHLCTASHDIRSPTFDLVAAPISLGDNAWAAAECFIGPGVSVGDSAVVAARCVLMKSLPDQKIAAGDPARIVGSRPEAGRNTLS